MFLSREELYELTDLKMPFAQCKWLTKHGYPFDISASGRPKVLRSYVEARLSLLTVIGHGDEPDFNALC